MWEAHHQKLQSKALASHLRLEVAEIDLSCAWGPLKLEEALLRPLHVLALPCCHMPSDRGVGAGIALLGNCPVEDSLGRMPLLSRHRLVTCECRIDPAGQAIRRRVGASLRDGRLGRHIPFVCVLRDGVAAQIGLAGDAGSRHTVSVHLPDILLFV